MLTSSKSIHWWALFLLALLLVLIIFFIQAPKACQKPITYRLGMIDERFNIDREEFQKAIHKAAAMWGEPLHRDLFQEDPEGAIEVNLIYDYRQEATDKLKKLHYKIDRSMNSYDELKSRLDNLNMEHERKKAGFEADLNAYNIKVNTFNTEAESWSQRGDMPQSIHTRLSKEKDELAVWKDNLQISQEEMKTMVDTINSIIVVMNEIASNNNLDMIEQKNIGDSVGREFCEGFYEHKKGRQSITIYQYDNESRLVRVLAHEFGHALGLNHSHNKEAVMYPLIHSDSLALSADDIKVLKGHCKNL